MENLAELQCGGGTCRMVSLMPMCHESGIANCNQSPYPTLGYTQSGRYLNFVWGTHTLYEEYTKNRFSVTTGKTTTGKPIDQPSGKAEAGWVGSLHPLWGFSQVCLLTFSPIGWASQISFVLCLISFLTCLSFLASMFSLPVFARSLPLNNNAFLTLSKD